MPKDEVLVIKFGGSYCTSVELGGINPDYFHAFWEACEPYLHDFAYVALVIGGGERARLRQAEFDDPEEKDHAGIEVTHQHAAQLRDFAEALSRCSVAAEVPTDPISAQDILENCPEKVKVFGGLQVGQSTDAVAAFVAQYFVNQGFDSRLLILSNVDAIYTANPNTDPNAQPISSATIDQLIALGVLLDDPDSFKAGMHVVIDPVATGVLRDIASDMAVYFTEASQFEDIQHFLDGGIDSVQTGTVLIG